MLDTNNDLLDTKFDLQLSLLQIGILTQLVEERVSGVRRELGVEIDTIPPIPLLEIDNDWDREGFRDDLYDLQKLFSASLHKFPENRLTPVANFQLNDSETHVQFVKLSTSSRDRICCISEGSHDFIAVHPQLNFISARFTKNSMSPAEFTHRKQAEIYLRYWREDS
jgi:hypothetical protein